MAAQALTARTIYSIARDGVLPGVAASCARSTAAGRRSARSSSRPRSRCLGLLLGLHSAAVGSLIAFGTAAIYVAFLLVALAALIARVRGTWVPARARAARPRRARRSTCSRSPGSRFETVNIAWPRASLAPPGAPGYQVWAAPIVLAVIAVAGLGYLVLARPQRRVPRRTAP